MTPNDPAILRIPTFKLFGEEAPWPTPDMLHCESIAARSSLHDWRIAPHRHNGLFQLVHLAQGRALVRVDERDASIAGGALVLVPPMCVHGFAFEPDAQGHVVTFASPLIRRLAQGAGDPLAALAGMRIFALAADEESSWLEQSFRALEREYRGAAAHRGEQVEILLAGILVAVARRCALAGEPAETNAPAPRRADGHVASFCALIEAHYREQAPVAFYARRLGITAAHLNALCRGAVGKTALALVHERVLLEAKRSLVYTSMTVAQVSDAAGFKDPAYFTRFFTRATGLSPRAFRQGAGTLET